MVYENKDIYFHVCQSNHPPIPITCVNQTIHRYLSLVEIKPSTYTHYTGVWQSKHPLISITCGNQTINSYLSLVAIKPATHTHHLWNSNHPPILITVPTFT